jgi:hypothetical protein
MPDLQSLSSVQKSPSKCSPRGNHIQALWAQPRVGMLFPLGSRQTAIPTKGGEHSDLC